MSRKFVGITNRKRRVECGVGLVKSDAKEFFPYSFQGKTLNCGNGKRCRCRLGDVQPGRRRRTF